MRMGLILLTLATVFLLTGCLSTPRNFASPEVTVRIVDGNDLPLKGIEVERSWYDSDRGKEGSSDMKTNAEGIAEFPLVRAHVFPWTGAIRKFILSMGPCGPGSGTDTQIIIRYPGRYDVWPKDKPLHPVGESYQDPDGVWFSSNMTLRTHRASSTTIVLTPPEPMRRFNYTLISRPLN